MYQHIGRLPRSRPSGPNSSDHSGQTAQCQMSRTQSARTPPAPQDVFTLCGQQVKVKNTFLDDLIREKNSSNESTLEAHTCPEFRRSDVASSGSSSGNSGPVESGSSFATPEMEGLEGMEGIDPDSEDPEGLPEVESFLTLTPPISLRYSQYPQTMPMPAMPPMSTPDLQNLHGLDFDAQLLCALQAVPNAPCGSVPPVLPNGNFPFHETLLSALPALPGVLPGVPGMPGMPLLAPVLSTMPGGPKEPLPFDDVPVGAPGLPPVTVLTEMSPASDDVPQENLVEDKQTRRPGAKKKPAPKIWCHFYLEPQMLRTGFDVNKKIIGHGGTNTKRIFEKTGAKIRLRGRGSGHNEGDRGEAPVPLMLAVTSDTKNVENFVKAVELSVQLLQTVTSKFPEFCRSHGTALVPQPLFWIGELSQDAVARLQPVSESQVIIGETEVIMSLEGRSVTPGLRW
ncbi:unnamed protein product [Durusdinium trenchii]|uniref:KHDC4/BBP-like KH-domain type I domain-containing protein n=2 Tax=Durusdinium trenchii TaxID=1381693 RepID=A0ABP0K115_9DINO